MPDLGGLLNHWGYLAIFVFVILGNMGAPLPEETILALAGYMVWHGQLELLAVLLIGILSAILGDNLGYWLGRRYGRGAIERYGQWVLGRPARLQSIEGFVARHGSLAVFVARFVPGVRFMAGPLAGALQLPFSRFVVANLLGAALYVPVAVGVGYAIGLGLGEYVEMLRRIVGSVEHTVLVSALCLSAAVLVWRVLRALMQWRDT